MCGLFGSTLTGAATPAELKHLRAARDSLTHRGPDSQGDYHNDDVYVGHTRLAIVDTSADGNQPMCSSDGRLVLAVNGEIYNFIELKSQLERSHPFHSSSDSEVILHGYREWGIQGLLDRLEGMFAFVLLDTDKQQLFLARDRVGIKPLYIYNHNGRVAWASELKALERFADSVELRTPALTVDYSAIYDYLTYQYIPTPKSLYREVTKLRPGHYLSVDLGSARTREQPYWHIDEAIASGHSANPKDIADLLRASVSRQMISDVPLGFFLSGGIDSTAVVTTAAEMQANLATFSIGFDRGNNELPIAAQTADRLRTHHTAAVLQESAASPLIQQMRTLFDEPFADTSALPTYLVAKLAREQVTVVLTGDGGDEVFSGYGRYEHLGDRNLTARSLPGLGVTCAIRTRVPQLRKLTRGVERYALLQGFGYYTRLLGGLIEQEKVAYRRAWQIERDYDDYWHFREHYDANLDPQTALQRLDFLTYLPDDILTKVDRTTMAHSLEARVPLLDTALLSAAFATPANKRGSNKQLLKRAMSERIPDAILGREKTGFSVPAAQWRSGVFETGRSRAENLLHANFTELELP
ncbi:MAG: asparagine synthase (glutamine-hydrolyzing) [Pseudomonadaceae bacterium]|nr:asparagine synthase (glutamine-hydrolyzing) [Pseudomonadaceae bacterium]